MKILGLDVGEKRIGVARVDLDTRIAIPSGVIAVDGSEWQEIARLGRLYNTNWFVLGLPRSNEGNETQQSLYVRQFAKTLTEKIPGVKIRFQDESLTSVMAEERLKQRGKPYAKGDIDAEAATIILQDFVESGVMNAGTPLPADPLRAAQAKSLWSADRESPHSQQAAQAKTLRSKKEEFSHPPQNKLWKIITPIIVLAVLVGGIGAAIGVVGYIKDERARERAAEYARQEAEMQAEVFNFTIAPGETIYDVQESLLELGYSETEVAAGFAADYDFDFLRQRPTGATLEGYLYGETYEFYKDSTVEEILEVYLAKMGEVIEENSLEARYAAQGLTLHEGITLASVVQKEAPTSEMPTVAQVFLTRLDYGLALGSDVTVSYALDTLDPGRHTYTDNQAALGVDSCYNTRLYAGLPCGPISNPGLAALLAVAEPADSSYLYFLTGDDGLMYYSYTESEHNQNIYLYCQELCNTTL